MKRKDFTPSEAVAIGRLIKEQHRAKIEAAIPDKNRRAALIREARRRGDSTKSVIHLDGAPLGGTREIAAKAVGMSEQKYSQAKQIVGTAETAPASLALRPIAPKSSATRVYFI